MNEYWALHEEFQ